MRPVQSCLFAAAAVFLTGCVDPPAPVSPLVPNEPSLITNGTPTGSTFGAVGVVAFDFDRDGTIEGTEFICSGSLIAPTVFLTAAHCLSFLPPTAQLGVTFASNLLAPSITMILAHAFHFDPGFGHDAATSRDIGVVIIPPQSITPYQLPPAGYLDELAAQGGLVGQLFVSVGYGVSASRVGRPSFAIDGLRRTSTSLYQALRPAWLVLSMNTSRTGLGGDCYGDSGSPKLLDGNLARIVAITVSGDPPCRATSVDYRLDTDAARAFLSQYVAVP